MTVTLFISLFTIGSMACGLITEAVKKAYENAEKQYSANIIALVDALVVGGLGTVVAYMLLNVEWTVNNIICIVLMIVCIWLGAMLGFDKIKQTLEQIAVIIPKTVDDKDENNEDK